jgi:hypothetical protein
MEHSMTRSFVQKSGFIVLMRAIMPSQWQVAAEGLFSNIEKLAYDD